MSLPFGVRPPHEVGETPDKGHEVGAPVKTYLWIKVLAATIISSVLWGIMYWMITTELISFRSG